MRIPSKSRGGASYGDLYTIFERPQEVPFFISRFRSFSQLIVCFECELTRLIVRFKFYLKITKRDL